MKTILSLSHNSTLRRPKTMETTIPQTNDQPDMRIEKDLLGAQAVPVTALYGIQTQRAYQNFNITGVPISHFPDLIKALAMVKYAAARANYQHGLLSDEKVNAITEACE